MHVNLSLLLFVIFTVISVTIINSNVVFGQDIDELVDQGDELINLNSYKEAIASYDKVLEIDPNSVSALGGKGLALYYSGKIGEAIQYLDRALVIDPNNAENLTTMGMALLDYSGSDKVLIDLKKYGKGSEYISYIDKALEIDPDDELANASWYHYYGDNGRALFWYNELLKKEPDNVFVLTKKGGTLASLDDKEAITYFDKALAIDPNNIVTLATAAQALFYSADLYEEAASYYEKALMVDPTYRYLMSDFNSLFGSTYLDRPDYAIAVYDKVIARHPTEKSVPYHAALYLRSNYEYEKMLTYSDKALAIDPNDVEILIVKGISLYNLDRYEDAITYFDKALAIDPTNDYAMEYRAESVGSLQGETVMKSIPVTRIATEIKESQGGCLIATAAYGTELASQVQMLREIRDHSLLSITSGASFMTGFNAVYYSFSPTVADWERQSPIFKEAIKITIIPLLTSISILKYMDIDSEQQILGYGMGIILLNIGIYFVVPAILITSVAKRLSSIKQNKKKLI